MLKSIKMWSILVLISLLSLLCSCEIVTEQQSGYDGRTFDISYNQDGSLTATTTKVNNYFTLKIEGNGDSYEYSSKEKVPWNAIGKKINNVEISDGITSIGAYLFYSIPLVQMFIPATVDVISFYAFNEATTIYSYGNNIDSCVENPLYYYSETQPLTDGNYFYLEDGVIKIYRNISKKYSFLFIGNSFTYCPGLGTDTNAYIPRLFKEVATDLGLNVEVDFVTKGSHTLTKFSQSTDEMGSIVYEKLNNNQYDFIILQEHSTTPINNYNTFLTAVTNIKELVEDTQENAKIILYETWGFPGTSNNDVITMGERLMTAYTNCANELGLEVDEVGKAFNYVYEHYNSLNLYNSDNKHTSAIGAYLSTLVHIGSMLNIDFRTTTVTGGLEEETAGILKNVAYKIVFE